MSVLVVAECGIAHGGSLEKARVMLREAKSAGADAVKFACYHARKFCSDRAEWQGQPQADMFTHAQLSPSEFEGLKAEADEQGIEFFATAQDISAANFILDIGAKRIKVGSDDLTHTPYLRQLQHVGLPVILSTGMSTDADIEAALEALGKLDVTLMHCVSLYPTPAHRVNMGRMADLRGWGLPVGYSDHTNDTIAPVVAAALGATVIEKHFCLANDMGGPEGAFSVDQYNFADMVWAIRQTKQMLQPAPGGDLETRAVARRSIVAAVPLAAGQCLEMEHLAFKRPGDGIAPNKLADVLGYILKRDVEKDDLITREVLKP